MNEFLPDVTGFIQEKELLPRGCPVVVGVSGGADSLALLLILNGLRQAHDLVLQVAHLNHGLRGAEADEDEAFVRGWSRKLGIVCVVRRIDIRAKAREERKGIEETGRAARQAFFSELALALDKQLAGTGRPPARIALGHHLNDQAETIMMNLGRGSGLDGLVGIRPQNDRLIRPLLNQPRAAIEAWLMEQEITWRLDRSNLEPDTLRNRLRQQVLPAWQEALDYNPAPLLARLAANLEEDRNYLETLTLQAAADCLVDQRLAISVWKTFPPALQNRLLRLFWQQASGSKQDLGFVHIRLLRDWLPSAESGQRLSLPGNRQAILIDGYLQFMGTQSSADCFQQGAILSRPLKINLPGLTPIYPFNQKIAAYLIENDHDIVYNDSTEYFLLDRIRGSVVRHRQPGDRIRPAGRTGGKSLKKFLNEQQVPRHERNRLLLVAKGRDIVWLPGLAVGADFVARSGGPVGHRIALEISPLAATDM
ncbi:MAG: tRNA lysidine(34) synthetase TilS [Clostridiaceae bacterium]|nr:tRNA lysidine(34) synthetase TilS [Clostridiaceae bacterium]